MAPQRKGGRKARKAPADPALVEDLAAYIRRYMVLSGAQLLVIALWVIHTHCIDYIAQTPYLSITSPDSECGKSRLLEALELVARRAWMVIRPSDAVAYRFIDEKTPTLLLDEVDTIFNPQSARYHEGLRAIIDAGHRRGAMVPRAADFGRSVDHFSPFCPKALAGIGNLPDTISRRSIYIRLERKTAEEKVEKFIRREAEPLAAALDARIAAWAEAHGEAVGAARPAMPESLSDRMQEGCEPLIAIADAFGCGGEARAALTELMGVERLDNQETIRLRLLKDLKLIWDGRERERGRAVTGITTKTLLTRLCAIEEAGWHDYYGRGMLQPNDLASLLRHYGVTPQNIKMKDGKVRKGYRRDLMYPVFDRYVR